MPQHRFIAMADYQSPEPAWLWPGRIPRGSISLLEGDPGQGKTTLVCDLAGRITTRNPMPDTSVTRAPGNVILLEGEDSLATTRRNLQTSGADLARVFAWDRSVQGTGKPLAFPDDIDFLADQIRERSAELVVIDPVAAFLRVNIHNDQAVRKALSPLSGLAEETGAAIVLVRHLTKSGGANPLYRGAGSVGLIAAARSVLLVAPAPGVADQRVLTHSKSNLGPPPSSLAFKLASRGGGVAIHWIGPIQFTAEQLLDAGYGTSRSALNDAIFVLYSLLGDGPMLASEAKAAAAEAGIADRTLRRAKAILQVTSQRKGFGPGSIFYWVMPSKNDIVRRLRERDLDALVDRLCSGDSSCLPNGTEQGPNNAGQDRPPHKSADGGEGTAFPPTGS